MKSKQRRHEKEEAFQAHLQSHFIVETDDTANWEIGAKTE